MAIAIDSNVLLRYFTQDNQALFLKAEQLLDRAAPGSLVLDRLTIAELGYVLRSVYGFKKHDILPVYRSLLANDKFVVPDREMVEITIELFDQERPLSFEDCWLLALQRSGKVKAVKTFDRDLQKRLN